MGRVPVMPQVIKITSHVTSERTLMTEEYNGPCRTCGAPAHRKPVPRPKTINQPGAGLGHIRRCTNPECPTNTGSATLGQRV